jgi:predicted ATP-grasp superfamily ATP-dependent carboligase
VASTTIVSTSDELLLLAKRWPSRLNVVLQEYIPRDQAEDWIFHAYCDHDSTCAVGFTGVKLRSWPPHAGVTTYAVAEANAQLAEEASTLCRLLGYRGVVDLDWRFDRRDGRYQLVDFNPRLGAQFRLFQNEAGIDVVRALHLDLTGRAVPRRAQVDGRRLIVENLDAAAFLAYRTASRRPRPNDNVGGTTELAWTAPDDPVPLVAMGLRFAWVIGRRLRQLTRRSRPGPWWRARPARAGERSSKGS